MNYLISIVLAQGLFLFSYYLKAKKTSQLDFWFVGLIVSSILYFIFDDNGFIFHEIELLPFDHTLFITFLFGMICLPPLAKMRWHQWLIFLPNIVYAISEYHEEESSTWLSVLQIGITLIFLTYLILTVKTAYNAYRKKHSYLTLSFILISILLIVFELFSIFSLANATRIDVKPWQDDLLIILFVASLLYGIAFKQLMTEKKENKKAQYATSGISKERLTQLEKDFDQLMLNEKPYLNKKITLQTIASLLNVPKQYLSEMLTVNKQQNFTSLVNECRVKEFERRLMEVPENNLTLFGLAQECGFNSKSSFQSNFVKVKGITPSQYKTAISGNKEVQNDHTRPV